MQVILPRQVDPLGGGGGLDWRCCAARTTWPWHWENIKYDQKTLRLYTLREHKAYYKVEKHTWENTDKKNWQNSIPWENTCPQKVHPDGLQIPPPPLLPGSRRKSIQRWMKQDEKLEKAIKSKKLNTLTKMRMREAQAT